jgi:hypothetical protein
VAILRDADQDRLRGRPGATTHDHRLGPSATGTSRHHVIRDALDELTQSGGALYVPHSEGPDAQSIFTIARPGESAQALAARHHAAILERHPYGYLAAMLHAGPGLPAAAVTLARQNARLLRNWFPGGLPPLDMSPELRTRFKAYVDAVRTEAMACAALMATPALLREHLEREALPCERATRPISVARTTYRVEEGMEREDLLMARRKDVPRGRNATLWYPAPADPSQEGTVYLLTSSPDPITGRDRRVIGTASLTFTEMASCQLLTLRSARPRCCMELSDQAFLATGEQGPRLGRFHRHPGRLTLSPHLSASFPRHHDDDRDLEGDATRILLHFAGCLQIPPDRTQILWADSKGRGRAWEGLSLREVGMPYGDQRLLTRRTATLHYSDHPEERPPQPSVEEMRRIIAPLMSYVLSPRLLEI